MYKAVDELLKKQIEILSIYLNEDQLVEFDGDDTKFVNAVIETQDHIQMVMSLTNRIHERDDLFEDAFNKACLFDKGFIAENASIDNIVSTIESNSGWLIDEYLYEFGISFSSLTPLERVQKEKEIIKDSTRLCFIHPEKHGDRISNIVQNIRKLIVDFPKTLIVCNKQVAQEVFSGVLDREISITSRLYSPVIVDLGESVAMLTGQVIVD